MVPSNVQRIYDEHISGLSAGERLRLVELITRGMAGPAVSDVPMVVDVPAVGVAASAAEARVATGWQSLDRRGDLSEWRDRAL